MRYFNNLNTVAKIKHEYRKLCSIHHPDKGGDVEAQKEINIQYKSALEACHGQVSEDKTGKEHTYYYNEDIEQELIDKINELLALHLSNVEIALIGTWIWITGQTKEAKESLKSAKCKWHSKRKCWFYSTGTKKRWNSKASLSDLANTYGYKTFTDTTKAIN